MFIATYTTQQSSSEQRLCEKISLSTISYLALEAIIFW